MKKYLIVIEETGTGYAAYSPDLPTCVSTGSSRREVENNLRRAISFRVQELREEGEPAPEPTLTPRTSNSPPDIRAIKSNSCLHSSTDLSDQSK